VVDHFSKLVFLKAMKEATSAAVKFLTKEVFNTLGVPEIIHSDKDKQFVAMKFVEMTQSYQITHKNSDLFPFVKRSGKSESVRAQRDSSILGGGSS